MEKILSVTQPYLSKNYPNDGALSDNESVSASLQMDSLASFKEQLTVIDNKMMELNKQSESIDAEKKVLSKRRKIGAVMALAEVAGLAGAFALGSMPFTLAVGALGVACMVIAVKNETKFQTIKLNSEWNNQQRESLSARKHTFEMRISDITDLKKSAHALKSEGESKIDISDDEFVFIDGMRLSKKPETKECISNIFQCIQGAFRNIFE